MVGLVYFYFVRVDLDIWNCVWYFYTISLHWAKQNKKKKKKMKTKKKKTGDGGGVEWGGGVSGCDPKAHINKV